VLYEHARKAQAPSCAEISHATNCYPLGFWQVLDKRSSQPRYKKRSQTGGKVGEMGSDEVGNPDARHLEFTWEKL